VCYLFVLFIIACLPAMAQEIYLTPLPETELTEGQSYHIEWSAAGAQTVNVILQGERTPLGGKSRGSFNIVILQSAPAVNCECTFTMPWVDAVTFTLKAKGYDESGHLISVGEQKYRFRPAVMANRFEDGIFLDLHLRKNQRLYVQKDRAITTPYLSSSSENYSWYPPNVHPKKPHDHAGIFKVLDKNPNHWSKLYEVRMYWSMRYLSGHFIHATSPNLYKLLGEPASHGCNRLTKTDAKALYDVTPIGARVEVIGPEG